LISLKAMRSRADKCAGRSGFGPERITEPTYVRHHARSE
jgi:hypothetical protein